MAIMGFCFIGMSIFVIATFALYFFPYKRYGYQGKQRLVHIADIPGKDDFPGFFTFCEPHFNTG